MLAAEVLEILTASRTNGRVLEPDAKRLLGLAGLDVPKFVWALNRKDAVAFAGRIGYPVAAKVVSPAIFCKSDRQGVALGIQDDQELADVYDRFRKISGFAGILIEEMQAGLELTVGIARVDYHCGPAIFLGVGDAPPRLDRKVTFRLPPIEEWDVKAMIRELGLYPLFRKDSGDQPINIQELSRLLMASSEMATQASSLVESINLNPVICSPERCVVVDARIKLKMNDF